MTLKNTHPSTDSHAIALSPLARCLGYAGLLPFVLLAALQWTVPADFQGFVATGLVAYAAVIASFLGGVHWGIAVQVPQADAAFHYVWGIAPSLMAWVALVMPAHVGLSLLGLVLVACYLVDRRGYSRAGWAAWLPMRLQLTVVAVLSCVLGAAAV